jgi:hypothetical protein
MYVRKEVLTNSSSKHKGVKIGPDAMRFKSLDEELVKELPICVEGVIFNIGLDFVELLQNDHRIVTVMTDRITHVKWPDVIGREAVSTLEHEGKCRCVEFDRFTNHFDVKEGRGHTMKKQVKQSKKKGKKVKGDPHHCPHCGNYHSRLKPCRCKQEQRNHHQRPCGCKSKRVNHHQRPCGCKSKRVNHHQRPCGCREKHGDFKRSCGCHEQQINHHHNPCGCREQHGNFKRLCFCHEQRVNHHQRPCGCHEQHGNFKSPCGCHEHQERRCPHCLDEHHKRQHSYPMHHPDCCHKNLACFCDSAIPFCDRRFELRLAGLNDHLNFKLLQNKGRHVEMIVE